MDLMNAIIAGKLGGGSVTPASIVTATEQMTAAQASDTRRNLAGAGELFYVTFTQTATGYTTDYNYLDVQAAFAAGNTVLFRIGDGFGLVTSGHDTYDYYRAVVTLAQTTWDIWMLETGMLVVTGRSIEISPTVYNPSGATPSITPSANEIYKCGELTSLTISNPPSTGSYSIVFTSGSTATSTTIPATILGLESFAAEANTMYEINVLDNRAVVGSWAVSST